MTSICVVLGWIGALASAAQSPLLSNGAINLSYLKSQPALLELPLGLTIIWLSYVLPQDWSERRSSSVGIGQWQGSSAIAKAIWCFYWTSVSILLALIWMRVWPGY